jgi:phosphatidylserine decarboxylase
MPTLTREIREQLLTFDEKFQKLAQQHSEYEAQLKQLSEATYLNLEDLQRQVTLKKLKLSVKDAMEQYVAQILRKAPGR